MNEIDYTSKEDLDKRRKLEKREWNKNASEDMKKVDAKFQRIIRKICKKQNYE